MANITALKNKRGGARPGAGRPSKNGKRTNINLTEETRRQLLDIHPVLITAIEKAAAHYTKCIHKQINLINTFTAKLIA